ncbi:amidase [Actinophytocola xanthii]|nr:amidase [Actinophytocola xanthii]
MVELAAAVRRREISPVQLVEHYLERIERIDASIGAYLTVAAESALHQAEAAERALAGEKPAAALPPLLGVPVAVKDLTNVAGMRCTFGSLSFEDFISPIDDNVATLLRRAGMVVLGKTNTPEFGLACHTENRVAPPARTPWDLSRSAGGSSGGGAAAVAAGLAPVAQGNDGTGSNRIAASACGLVGLKPSRGRVSNGPGFTEATSFGLTTHGMIARTVGDCAALLDAIAVPMPGDPYPIASPAPGRTFLDHCGREPGRLRVGRHLAPVFTEADVDPECVAAYTRASELLAELGHDVEDITPAFDPTVVASIEPVFSMLALLAPVPPDREGMLMPLTRWLRGRGSTLSALDYGRALAATEAVSRTLLEHSWSYDVILTPTVTRPSPAVGAIRDDEDPAREFEEIKRFTPYTAMYASTGQPAISLPIHWTPENVPVGVMVVGRPGGESVLFSLGAQLEAVVRWQDRTPALFGG